jgi:hypothetical protein
MFVHLNDSDKAELIDDGKLTIVASKKNNPSSLGGFFSVMYRRKHPASLPTKLFGCFIMKTTITSLVRGIQPTDMYWRMSESMRYFFLDWFIDSFSYASLGDNRPRVTVYSDLPHVYAIMVDNGFQKISKAKGNSFKGSLDHREGEYHQKWI